MTHLEWIVPCYALAILVPAVLSGLAAHRLAGARRRLAALDRTGRGIRA